jgi:hypothetical protein
MLHLQPCLSRASRVAFVSSLAKNFASHASILILHWRGRRCPASIANSAITQKMVAYILAALSLLLATFWELSCSRNIKPYFV